MPPLSRFGIRDGRTKKTSFRLYTFFTSRLRSIAFLRFIDSHSHATSTLFAMSQEYFPGMGGSSAGEGSSRHPPDDESSQTPAHPNAPPAYMTVGNGSTSESATRLMATLDEDSGYGGSIASGSAADGNVGNRFRPELFEDRPTPAHTPSYLGHYNEAGELPWILG